MIDFLTNLSPPYQLLAKSHFHQGLVFLRSSTGFVKKKGFAGYTATEHNFQVDAQSVVVVLRRCLYPHFIRFEQLDTSLERMLAEKYMRTPGTAFTISESFLGTKNTETRIFEN